MTECPLCGKMVSIVQSLGNIDGMYYNCMTCGNYEITGQAKCMLRNSDYIDKKYILSAVSREASENKKRLDRITTQNIQELLESASIPNGPAESIDRILIYISRKAVNAASFVPITPDDYPIAYAKNISEFEYFLDHAIKLEYIKKNNSNDYNLTLKGWQRVDESKKAQADKGSTLENPMALTQKPSMKKIFISYSHQDKNWKDLLVKQLKVLSLEDFYDIWDDQRIDVGEDWKPKIEQAISDADIAILIVSADFLVSNFIRKEEIPRLLERREKEGLWVIPLFVKPCSWKKIEWLSKIQGEPRNNKTLAELDIGGQADRILVELAEKIIEKIQVETQK
ncbi:MAG: toll/interleukin-1 receptor domain-containing protein [Candidatus Aminicenantes bacterium]|nr:toll/interleukin-1 receptor domain-containing protein [Candidatus Aminicenantes bacterium]